LNEVITSEDIVDENKSTSTIKNEKIATSIITRKKATTEQTKKENESKPVITTQIHYPKTNPRKEETEETQKTN